MANKGNFIGFRAYWKLVKRKNSEALELFDKAFDNGLDNVDYLTAYGALLLKDSQFDRAIKAFRKALLYAHTTSPIMWTIKQNLATCYWKIGDTELALETAEAVYNKVKNSSIYGLYGYLLITDGQFEKALKINLEGYDYDDEDAAIIDNLGQLYYFMGDKQKAKEYFEKALELRGNMVDSLYFLAIICIEEGDTQKAHSLLEDAFDVDIPALATVTHQQIDEKYKETCEKLGVPYENND